MAAELGVRLPPDATLVVASSMPVRDVESFFPAREQPPRVLANRGANGIDGTVSTAFGVAATGVRTVLLIGDVALAHDIGGLLAARRLGLDLTIVLLNNDGGGIFHFLPVAGEGADFEEHVATPHGLDFARAAVALRPRPRARHHARVLPRRARQRERRHDHRDPHRPRREPRAPPAPRASRRAVRPRPHLACGSVQQSLIDTPAAPPPPPRATSKGIAPGDIVQVDKKGRRFHALVTELDQQESGRFELVLRPLDSRISYRTATVREVVEVWRKARRSG